uniref:Uncharacterized protein n=1 Tax=Strongyloides venezuelensis TaxID=75913 RepID=A0A0K0FM46_STRVS
MDKLVTLEFYMKIFLTPADVDNFIGVLSVFLKNVKFTDCKKLRGNSTPDTTIREIISYFKKLQSLSIYFKHYEGNVGLFTNFLGSDNMDPPRINK